MKQEFEIVNWIVIIGVKTRMESGFGSTRTCPECWFRSWRHGMVREKEKIGVPMLEVANRQCLCLNVYKSCASI